MTYQEYVNSAKKLLKHIECYQAKIAEMAINVCQIRHGGRSSGYYTLQDFADDIGMCSKSLQNWVVVYRDVLKKVNIKNPNAQDWSNATKTANFLKTQRTVENRSEGSTGTRRAYKREVPAEKVSEVFNEISSGNSPKLKFERIYSSTRFNNTVLRDLDLSSIDEKKLEMVMEWLYEGSEIINKQLEKIQRAKKSKRVA